MNIAYRLADLLCPASPPKYQFSDFIDIGPGCFATKDGEIICWKGENYVPQKPSLRVLLHNWLIQVGTKVEVTDILCQDYYYRGYKYVPMKDRMLW